MCSFISTVNGGDNGRGEPRSIVSSRAGVLLINLGTPDAADVPAVRRYLAEFLSDPEVIRLPRGLRWLNRPLGRFIAQRRAPYSAAMYQRIWSERGSPLGSVTEEQATLLESALPDGWRVFFAMRYGQPSIAETLRDIVAAGIEELVVLPMYPQFSGPTTGTALRELYGSLKRGHHRINVTTRNSWYDDGGYVHAQAKLIADYARRHELSPDNTYLVFSAHGLPVSYVERGDPYPTHVGRTVELVTERLGWPADRATLSYQSRFGPTKWLEPKTGEVLAELAKTGEKRVLICPVSFTTDCLETLEEIDLRYRAEFENDDRELYLCPALNTYGEFITALKNLVLRGPRPVVSWGEKVRPLCAGEPEPGPPSVNLDSLVMVGVSLTNRVGDGRGPQQVHAEAAAFHCAKKSQYEIPQMLRKVCEGGRVREAFVWNTCYRFEFYGWPAEGGDSQDDCIVPRVRECFLADEVSENLSVNVLCGPDAWHHLVRTAAGLNSGLPGDRDILDQLQTAYNLAQRAGTARAMTDQLITGVIDLASELRRQTDWGRFDPGYCSAALSKVVESTGLELADCRCLVIGGSTTSRSVLSTLIERFEVPGRQITLAYRGHGGGQIKLLRKAIRNGRRLRVQSYAEPQVIRALADADVVIFGIDRDQPVLDAEQLGEARHFTARPLTVFDFNTFGSTKGWDSIPGVNLFSAQQLDDAAVAFAEALCARPEFARAIKEAEDWIVEHAPLPDGGSSQPLRCHGLVGEAAGDRPDNNPTPVEERWRRCLRCAPAPLMSETASVGSHQS